MNRVLFSLPILALLATAGCNPSNNCQRRPWECPAAASDTGGASGTVGGGGGGDGSYTFDKATWVDWAVPTL